MTGVTVGSSTSGSGTVGACVRVEGECGEHT